MNINQVQSFSVYRFGDGVTTRLIRNPFSQNGDSDAFIYERSDHKGRVLSRFTVMLSTAESSLRKALELRHFRPDLISVEVEKLSTGTAFNYPIPVI